jgi:hypothetical protein
MIAVIGPFDEEEAMMEGDAPKKGMRPAAIVRDRLSREVPHTTRRQRAYKRGIARTPSCRSLTQWGRTLI